MPLQLLLLQYNTSRLSTVAFPRDLHCNSHIIHFLKFLTIFFLGKHIHTHTATHPPPPPPPPTHTHTQLPTHTCTHTRTTNERQAQLLYPFVLFHVAQCWVKTSRMEITLYCLGRERRSGRAFCSKCTLSWSICGYARGGISGRERGVKINYMVESRERSATLTHGRISGGGRSATLTHGRISGGKEGCNINSW